ncbi:MAG: phage/plasmid primase, P4 family [Armatimonadota bacterium]|nr:phage/plasmid primase, P4 family [bacterium]
MANSNPTELILSRLNDVRKSGTGYIARCPAHDDNAPSLSISEGDAGQCLVHCHAGCEPEAILSTIGLTLKDLYPPKHGGQITGRAAIEQVYPYVNKAGEVLYEVVRYKNPKGFKQRVPNSTGGYCWSMKGVTRVLYQLPAVMAAIERNVVIFLVEGEKDVHSLHDKLFLSATCNAGGAGKWQPTYSKSLTGADVVILPDNDIPGREHAGRVAQALQGYAKSVRVLELPGLPDKGDVSDWIAAGGSRDELVSLVESCPQWQPNTLEVAKSANLAGNDEGFPLTDLGNAERLIAAHGKNLRYNVDSGKWLHWNDKRWEPDCTGEVDRLARQTIRAIADEIASIYTQLSDVTDSDERDNMRKRAESLSSHMKNSESIARLDAMIALARYCTGVPVTAGQLDSDGWLLNCSNGTVDLRTGELREHSQADLMTKLCPVDYDPAAACPTWEKTVSEVFDNNAELVSYYQRAQGYCLTADTSEQCFFLLHGDGSNGKSTLLNVAKDILADYSRSTGVDTLMVKSGASVRDMEGVGRLMGSRFVSAIETDVSQHLAEGLVKSLTGQDVVTGAFLYGSTFEFRPTFKLWLACNHKPVISGDDWGVWRRVRLVPFNVQFDGDRRDAMLPDKLKLEYIGILNWMVQGCLAWQSAGLGTCDAVNDATADYRKSQDKMNDFLSDCCTLEPDATCTSKVLYDRYKLWCVENGLRHPWTNKVFSQKLGQRGLESKHMVNGRTWTGIELNENSTLPPDAIFIDEEDADSTDLTDYDALTENPETFPHEDSLEKLSKKSVNASTFVKSCSDGEKNHGFDLSSAVINRHPECKSRAITQELLAWGQSHNYPRLPFQPGHAICEGQAAWAAFTARSSIEHRQVALLAATTIDSAAENTKTRGFTDVCGYTQVRDIE